MLKEDKTGDVSFAEEKSAPQNYLPVPEPRRPTEYPERASESFLQSPARLDISKGRVPSELIQSTETNSSTFRYSHISGSRRSFGYLATPRTSSLTKSPFKSRKSLADKLRELEEEFKDSPEKEESIQETEVKEAEFVDSDDEETTRREISRLKWCAYCKAERTTEVKYQNSRKTLLSAISIFFMGGVFGCFMVPYMTNTCKQVKIICHTCKRPLS